MRLTPGFYTIKPFFFATVSGINKLECLAMVRFSFFGSKTKRYLFEDIANFFTELTDNQARVFVQSIRLQAIKYLLERLLALLMNNRLD